MTHPPSVGQRSGRGFTLIELMVTVSIVTLMVALGAPSFGSAVRTARERTVVQRLVQDFTWARAAAGGGSAAAYGGTNANAPVMALTLRSDCGWKTTINGTDDPAHSMTAAQLAEVAPGITCEGSGGVSLPATINFSRDGSIDTTGNLTFTSMTGQKFPMTIPSSGSIIRTSPVTGKQV